MKHLKTFKNNTQLYKEYIVTDFNPYYKGDPSNNISSGYYIFRILPNTTETKFYFDTYYYINKLNGKLITANSEGNYTNYKNNPFDIIYQSNSLEDASDFLEMTRNIKKYNL